MTKQERIDRETAEEMTDRYDWEAVVNLMDDTIREAIHAEIADGMGRTAFLARYIAEHRSTYGEEFTIN